MKLFENYQDCELKILENDIFQQPISMAMIDAIYLDLQLYPQSDMIAESLCFDDFAILIPGEIVEKIGENITATFGSVINVENEIKRLGNAIKATLAKDGLELVDVQAGNLRKKSGMQYVPVQFNISDGQTITMFFHDPSQIGGVKNKINYKTKLVAYETRLNKQPVTAAITKARGKQLSIKQTGDILAGLAVANKAKWAAKEEKRNREQVELEELQATLGNVKEMVDTTNQKLLELDQKDDQLLAQIETLKSSIQEKNNRLASLQSEIDALQKNQGAEQMTPDQVGVDGKGVSLVSKFDPAVRTKIDAGEKLSKSDIKSELINELKRLKEKVDFKAGIRVNMKVNGDFSSASIDIKEHSGELKISELRQTILVMANKLLQSLGIVGKGAKVTLSKKLEQDLQKEISDKEQIESPETPEPTEQKGNTEYDLALKTADEIRDKTVDDMVAEYDIEKLRELDFNFEDAVKNAQPDLVSPEVVKDWDELRKKISTSIDKKLAEDEMGEPGDQEETETRVKSIASKKADQITLDDVVWYHETSRKEGAAVKEEAVVGALDILKGRYDGIIPIEEQKQLLKGMNNHLSWYRDMMSPASKVGLAGYYKAESLFVMKAIKHLKEMPLAEPEVEEEPDSPAVETANDILAGIYNDDPQKLEETLESIIDELESNNPELLEKVSDYYSELLTTLATN